MQQHYLQVRQLKAQATSLGVSPQQVGKTVTNNMTQATSNSDVQAELNLGKELVCGSAAVLNGPSGLLVGSVCNSLVAKLNSTSQQQSQPSTINSPSKGTQASSPGFINSPSKGTQASSPGFINSPSKGPQASSPGFINSPSKGTQASSPGFINSPSKGTQASSPKKSVSTSQPSTINSPSKGTQATSNSDVQAELNLGKELVCGSAAVLNGPSGLLVGSVCNSLVAKLNSTSQQQSQPSTINSPSKGTQASSPGFINSPSKGTQASSPGFINSPSKGTQASSPGFINSPSKGTQASSPGFINSPSKGTQASSPKKSVSTFSTKHHQFTKQRSSSQFSKKIG